MSQFDSYEGLDVRLKWDGKYVPGIRKISPLRRATAVVPHRDGSTQSTEKLSPGTTTYEPILLERTRTTDTAFEEWANQLISITNGAPVPALNSPFRKDIVLELYNQSGQLLMLFNIYRCWPSNYQSLSALDAEGSALLAETLTLQNEGWARDITVSPPQS